MRCNLSLFRRFLRSSINVILCILWDALLMSRRSRYTVSSFDEIVLSIIRLVASTCSDVDPFLRYTAWDIGTAESDLQS